MSALALPGPRRRLPERLVWVVLLALAGCAGLPRPPAEVAAPGAPPYEDWGQVLAQRVDDQGRVDFVGLAAAPAALDRFVDYVHRVAPARHPALFPDRRAVLAYHLNAYNALAMRRVIDAGIPDHLAGWRKLGFFVFGRQPVGGEPLSLYGYENGVIRALGDARVHVALNCMSAGCPRLPREPFLPDRVDEQLDREARRFYNEPRNVRVDDEARVLWLSEILKFYTADFLAEAPSLAAYVSRYRDRPLPDDYDVRFIPYDWTIHRQPER